MYIDYFITAIFTVECILKVISYGFVRNGEDSYLRSGWNILDFLIVVVSLVSLAT
jgi:hypothetical protein